MRKWFTLQYLEQWIYCKTNQLCVSVKYTMRTFVHLQGTFLNTNLTRHHIQMYGLLLHIQSESTHIHFLFFHTYSTLEQYLINQSGCSLSWRRKLRSNCFLSTSHHKYIINQPTNQSIDSYIMCTEREGPILY